MKNSVLKLMSIILITLFVIAIIPMAVKAANTDGVILEKTNGEKIIYIKGFDQTEFKYAFSNNESDASSATYITATKDSNGENVAYLDAKETYEYMFIQDGENTETLKLDSLKTITEKEISDVEKLTKIIKVSTDESDKKVTKDGDTTITTSTGKIIITDKGDYQYELIEVVDKNNSVEKINDTALELYNQLEKLNSDGIKMYDKLLAEITVRDNYKKILKDATWTDAKNKTIPEPNNSQNGEKFVVLIREVKDGKTVREDVEFMTCSRADDKGVEKEEKQVEKKKKLPITGENLALYIVFGIIILAIIVLIVRMNKAKKDEKK